MDKGRQRLVVRVASEFVSYGDREKAVTEIFELIQITLGIEDYESIVAWLDIGRTIVIQHP